MNSHNHLPGTCISKFPVTFITLNLCSFFEQSLTQKKLLRYFIHSMTKLSKLTLFSLLLLLAGCGSKSDFVKVNNTHFEIADKKYYFLGTNFWYGLNLGSKGEGGDRERLKRELDRLQALGVNNLRIM